MTKLVIGKDHDKLMIGEPSEAKIIASETDDAI